MTTLPRKTVKTHPGLVTPTGRTLNGTLPVVVRPRNTSWAHSDWIYGGGIYTWGTFGASYSSSTNDFTDYGTNPTGANEAGHSIVMDIYYPPPISDDLTPGDGPTAGPAYIAVQTETAVELWNYSGSYNLFNDSTLFGSLHQTLDNAPSNGEPAGLVYEPSLSELWWAWRVGNEVTVYRNNEQFAVIQADYGFLLYADYKIFFGGSNGSVAFLLEVDPFQSFYPQGLVYDTRFVSAITEPDVDFVEVWTETYAADTEFRPFMADHTVGTGIWCWKKTSGDSGAGTLMYWNRTNMNIVHTDMWYAHTFGGSDGACYFVDGNGNDRYGDGRGFTRAATYDGSDATNTEIENTLGISGATSYRWVPERDKTGVTTVPANGWVLGTASTETNILLTSSRATRCRPTLNGSSFADGNLDEYGILSQAQFLVLEEESTVWIHVVASTSSTSTISFPCTKMNGASVLINGIEYGPSPLEIIASAEEGLSSSLIPGRSSFPFDTDVMEYTNIYGNTISHSVTVNLPAGEYYIQGRANVADHNLISVGGQHNMQTQVTVVDYDEDAPGFKAVASLNGGYDRTGPIASDGEYLYQLGHTKSSGPVKEWGLDGLDDSGSTKVLRWRIVAEGQTPYMLTMRDFGLPLVCTNDINDSSDWFLTLTGRPNDAMAIAESSLFYFSAPTSSAANGTILYKASLFAGASSTPIYTAPGAAKGLAYHPIDGRLYFFVSSGSQTGLWSVTTSGSGARLERAVSLIPESIYNSTHPTTFWKYHDSTNMHGQLGCADDGSVWFRLVSGSTFSMNRWHPTDGLATVSSIRSWEIGANTIPVEGGQIISVAGPVLAGMGNQNIHTNGASGVYRYWYEGGAIQRAWSNEHREIIMADDYCYHAINRGNYDEGVIVCCPGFTRYGDYYPDTRALLRIWGPTNAD